ncbi:MAG TPA: YafY family protein, partial [Thermomicrobiales bacterium]|nr:YafY family protein [Thermomicrobiales bacterium]
FAITTMLQRKGTVRAVDLAAAFEVSTRTIYRDITALSEAGVPVVSLPGKGYTLTEGFFLPPLVFTTGEAAAVALGTRMLATQASGRHVKEAERALEKIAAVLPNDVRDEVDRLNGIITISHPPGRFDLDDPNLVKLQQAILEHRVVSITYHSRTGDEITERQVEPVELAYIDHIWYLGGYCRLRRAHRSFRVNRMTSLTIGEDRFISKPSSRGERRPIEVKVRFAEEVLPWVRERPHWSFEREEADGDGAVMTFLPDHLTEISSWILSWGAAAEPLTPPELRALIRAEAGAIAERLT